MPKVKTVPHQRVIDIKKQPCNAYNLFTTNNLKALDEAAGLLQSDGGFKLYVYMAKNQDKYSFALSSSDFRNWSGLGKTAYTTAFNELIDKGYLVLKEKKGTISYYIFYDKARSHNDNVIIEIPPDKVRETQRIKRIIKKG